MLGKRGVADAGTDQQSAVGSILDDRRQAGDIDQPGGLRHRFAHQIDQIGAAAQKMPVGGQRQPERILGVGGAIVAERGHAASSRAIVPSAGVP